MSDKIEGIPGGWELVRIGKAKGGDWYLDGHNEPYLLEAHETIGGCAIIRKIEPPKPTYVPWTFETCPIGCVVKRKSEELFRAMIVSATISGVSLPVTYRNYQELLNEYVQLDGTPCGTVEVQE